MSLTRRRLFSGAAALAGASLLPRPARASSTEPTTVVVVHLDGGLHSLFAQADSFLPRGLFSCSGSNTTELGNGVVVDNATFGTLGATTLAHMCNLGVWHGITAHDRAETALMIDTMGLSYPLRLAYAMGGDSPVACADLGQQLAGQHKPVGAAALSKLTDAGAVLTALGAAPADPYKPARAPALAGLKATVKMSTPLLANNQRSLASLTDGYASVLRALSGPAVAIDWPAIAGAYGLGPGDTLVTGWASQFATAELLVQAGTSVVLVAGPSPGCTLGFDTHADPSGDCARVGMTDLVLPPMRTFLSRMLALPGHNVVTAIIGDFTRSADSNHSGMLVASAWGKRLTPGTSGAFTIDAANYDSYVPKSGQAPGIDAFWAFLAEAAGVSSKPFGANPHPFVGA